jgi:hypothetical protein
LPGILEDASAKLSGALRVLLAQLKLELDHLQMRIDEGNRDSCCRRYLLFPQLSETHRERYRRAGRLQQYHWRSGV